MKHLSKESITKLRDLEKYILDVPARFNLALWGAHIDKSVRDKELDDLEYDLGHTISAQTLIEVLEANPPCGTVACLAGNVCVMAGLVDGVKVGDALVYRFEDSTLYQAREYLGITRDQAGSLFFPYDEDSSVEFQWPEEWQNKLNATKPGTKEYAQVAVDRIEHFITTGK